MTNANTNAIIEKANAVVTNAIVAATRDYLANTRPGMGQSTKAVASFVCSRLGDMPVHRVRYALDKLEAAGDVARERDGGAVYWHLTETAQQANIDHAASQLAEAMGVDSLPQDAPEGVAFIAEAGPLTTDTRSYSAATAAAEAWCTGRTVNDTWLIRDFTVAAAARAAAEGAPGPHVGDYVVDAPHGNVRRLFVVTRLGGGGGVYGTRLYRNGTEGKEQSLASVLRQPAPTGSSAPEAATLPLTTPSELTEEQVLAASRKLYNGETAARRRVLANGNGLRLIGGALRTATQLLANASSVDLTVAGQDVKVNPSSVVVSGAALFVLVAELTA